MHSQLDVGAVVRKVFRIYVDQARVLMPAAAVVFVFTGIVANVIVVENRELSLIALLIDLLAFTLFAGMVVELVADLQDGRRDATPGQLVRAVSPVFGQLLTVGIVAAVGIVIGLALFILPGLILLTIWSLVAPVVVLERPGAFAALARSRELVRGNGMRVFAVILVLVVLVGIAAYLVELLADSAGSGVGLVATVVIEVLRAPLAALGVAVLYFELGGRRPSARSPEVPEASNPFGA